MSEIKTGAIICRKPDDEKGMIYRAVIFIKNIPLHITDSELKSAFVNPSLPVDLSSCEEVFFRADIHATSNEVQEQFEHLHQVEVPEINYLG